MDEFELNLQVPAATAALLLAEFRRRGARRVHLQAHYHDTADDLLALRGLSLRLRKEGRRWVQTLKASTDNTLRRGEDNISLVVPNGTQPQLDAARHVDGAASAALRKALADLPAPSPLVERCATDVWRHRCEVQLPEALIEVALDIGTIRAKGAGVPICEVEFELKQGRAAPLFDWARSWVGEGGLWLNTVSKAQRGLMLARGEPFAAPVKAAVPHLHARLGGAMVLRSAVGAALEQVLANASALAAGSTQAEHVHQLRVGLRRVRTALRELGPLGEAIDANWERLLARTFEALGRIRDLDTTLQTVAPLLRDAGALAFEWPTAPPSRSAQEIVRERGFQQGLIDLLGFTSSEPDVASTVDVKAAIGARLAKLDDQVRRAAKRFESLPSADQHQVRKRLKRLRYLAEFVTTLYKRDAVHRFVESLEPAQDALGRHNDIAVAAAFFRREAERDPRALFAAGFLQAHLKWTAHEAGSALRKALKAPRFWQR